MFGQNTTRYNDERDADGFYYGYYNGNPFKTRCIAVLIMSHNKSSFDR